MCENGVRIRTRGQQDDIDLAASKLDELMPLVEHRVGGRKAALGWLSDQLGVSSMWIRRIRGRFGEAVVWNWQMGRLDELLIAEERLQRQRFERAAARIAGAERSEDSHELSEEEGVLGAVAVARLDAGSDRVLVARSGGGRGHRAGHRVAAA